MLIKRNDIVVVESSCREIISFELFNIMMFEMMVGIKRNIDIYLTGSMNPYETLKYIDNLSDVLLLKANGRIRITNCNDLIICLNEKSTIIPISSLITGVIKGAIAREMSDAYIERLKDTNINTLIAYSILAHMGFIDSCGIQSYNHFISNVKYIHTANLNRLSEKFYKRKIKNITKEESSAVEIFCPSSNIGKATKRKIENGLIYYFRKFKEFHLENI